MVLPPGAAQTSSTRLPKPPPPRRAPPDRDAPAQARPEQPRGQAGGEVLHPPAAFGIARKLFDRLAARQPDVAGEQRDSAEPLKPLRCGRRIAQGQVEWRRRSEAGGDCLGLLAPALHHYGGQGRDRRQLHRLLGQRRKHPVRQSARPAGQQRQSGGDNRMRRGLEPQPARQHQPQHRARLGIGGQRQAGGAVDQRVEIDQPAQRLASQRPRQGLVGLAANPLQGRVPRLFERLAAPQHGIEQVQRSLARGKAGNVHGWVPRSNCPAPPAGP
jgi:hypothetical protein